MPAAKLWSAVATVAKTKELKKRYGAEEGRIITSVLERAVSRERLFLFSARVGSDLAVALLCPSRPGRGAADW